MLMRAETLLWLTGLPVAMINLAALVGPLVVAIGVAICGLVMLRSPSRRTQRTGMAVIALGVLGLVASAAWIVLALYVESVVR